VATERVATMIKARDLEGAEKALGTCSNYEGVSAEYHYQMAQLKEAQGAHGEGQKHAKKALALVPDHTGSLFMLALRSDLVGNDDEAIEYYRQIIASSKGSVNVWLNLAILYEDRGDYDKASTCTEAVLTAFPAHPRALLFQKDIDSSKTMFFDEEREKKLSRKNQILETPISDFELSVRSRNCLKKMSILTLGDLLNISEAELLSYKNFGETSLREIKAILDTKGLGLGMALDDKHFAKKAVSEPAHEEDQGLLSKPVDDLQLSVRARKCIQKLNIRTIGDMTRTTDAELLGCKNFGVTSLNEINKALNSVGLSLRSLD
jgi:DNA-directed RNA polymerase subunit alpha